LQNIRHPWILLPLLQVLYTFAQQTTNRISKHATWHCETTEAVQSPALLRPSFHFFLSFWFFHQALSL